jgi:excisionase family DNA binding protein
MINENISEKLITSRQAAKYLCICERKLWDLSKSGRIQTVRIDRAVRFDIADLDSFIQQHKTETK